MLAVSGNGDIGKTLSGGFDGVYALDNHLPGSSLVELYQWSHDGG
jgi:hypothetical protein